MSILSKFSDVSVWEDGESRANFLAHQLSRGRLSIVLGAGASVACGLPAWDKLTWRLLRTNGTGLRKGESLEAAAERVFRDFCSKGEIKFAKLVRGALYKDFSMSFARLQRNPLLPAIAAVTLGSKRGSAASVVTFNFDDLLEEYLRLMGFSVSSVDMLPCWNPRGDVVILHPHGRLPSDKNVSIRRGIVFQESHFDRVVGDAKDAWRRALMEIWTRTTCLFIGLSGNDPNLRSILSAVKVNHCSKEEQHPFWGVRLAKSRDARAGMWKDNGVFHWKIRSHNDIPGALFDLCQRAAERSAEDANSGV